jgi:MoxR-like ATPase
MRAARVTTSELRRHIVKEALARLEMAELGEALEDAFQSIIVLGPPGVGKSTVFRLAARDVAEALSQRWRHEVEVVKVSMRAGREEALRIAERVVERRAIPYVHIYLPQTKIWHLEGTPSPSGDTVEVKGRRIDVNVWRLDPFIIPFLDYGVAVPAFIVLDEFNMARKDVLDATFQLARSAELGRARLNPFSIVALAGNTPEHNIHAGDVPQPLLDRGQVFIVVRPTVDQWISYMAEVYGERWDRRVAGYLTLNPKDLLAVGEGGVQTPRSWTHLAVRLHYYRRAGLLDDGAVEKLAYSMLREDTASRFLAYMRAVEVVAPEHVLRRPDILRGRDENTLAYALAALAVHVAANWRRWGRGERDEATRAVAEAVKIASERLGPEAVSIAVSVLPLGARAGLARDEDVARLAREAVEELREVERIVGG